MVWRRDLRSQPLVLSFAYSAAALRASPYAVPGLRASGFMGSQVILPLAHTLEHEEVIYN